MARPRRKRGANGVEVVIKERTRGLLDQPYTGLTLSLFANDNYPKQNVAVSISNFGEMESIAQITIKELEDAIKEFKQRRNVKRAKIVK
jgi:hypothetical protein